MAFVFFSLKSEKCHLKSITFRIYLCGFTARHYKKDKSFVKIDFNEQKMKHETAKYVNKYLTDTIFETGPYRVPSKS